MRFGDRSWTGRELSQMRWKRAASSGGKGGNDPTFNQAAKGTDRQRRQRLPPVPPGSQRTATVEPMGSPSSGTASDGRPPPTGDHQVGHRGPHVANGSPLATMSARGNRQVLETSRGGGQSNFPEVLTFTMLGAAAWREDGVGAIDGPVHPRALQARADNALAAATLSGPTRGPSAWNSTQRIRSRFRSMD